MIRNRFGVAIALTVTLLATSGCGLLGSEESASEENGGGGNTGASGDAEPGGADTETVIAEGTYQVPDLEGGSAHLEIHELRAQGQLAQLSFSLTVEDPEGNGMSSRPMLWDHWRSNLTTYLVDNVNGNRHAAVVDEDDNTLSPDAHQGFDYGDKLSFGWTFAAPPEDVETMDVYIDDYPPFTDIPVER